MPPKVSKSPQRPKSNSSPRPPSRRPPDQDRNRTPTEGRQRSDNQQTGQPTRTSPQAASPSRRSSVGDQEGPDSPPDHEYTRIRFIGKVYTLLVFEILLIFSIIYPFNHIKEVTKFLTDDRTLFWFLFASSLIIFITLLCILSYTQFPFNCILLQVAILCLGTLVSSFTIFFTRGDLIHYAYDLTFKFLVVISFIAFISPVDATKFQTTLTCISLVGMLLAISSSPFYWTEHSTTYCATLSIGFIIIDSAFLLVHTQLVMGDRHLRFATRDWVRAVLYLMVDIMFLFFFILRCYGCGGNVKHKLVSKLRPR
ncbi:hypothetical protein WDU94_007087 [Cyamophila willieti]